MVHCILAAFMLLESPSDSTIKELDSVMVVSSSKKDFLMKSSLTNVSVNKSYLKENFGGSLMQTLEHIPGVQSMSIGSGQSKPIIRGLGFNRVVVAEDGIKHEGQQWGDDHGLETDQFAVDRVEIVKGPAALSYGSDAIGGVMSLYTNHKPVKSFEGNAKIFCRSNNESLGMSFKAGGRNGKFHYTANLTWIDYADYKVPTDSIQYYSYFIKLKDNRLRNTAGTERDASLLVGYAGYNFHTDLRVSDSYSKSGFFADAHGMEVRLSDIDYDSHRRDVDLPYQWVNHLKVMSHSVYNKDMFLFDANIAYQNNHREELSEPVSHGYMPKPDGNMERRFSKDTYTANLMLRLEPDEKYELTVGSSTEYQHNRIGGWGFIIPDYETLSTGAYALGKYMVNDNLRLNAGVRYDHVRTHIHEYHDWYKTPVSSTDSLYKQRSCDLSRNFNSLTWSAGVNYAFGRYIVKANVGKSFRVPIAKELGADGVNYHIFRYERGNATLDPEVSYQFDLSLFWSNDRLSVEMSPYVNYFPNYIYLNPTSDYVEGLQLYNYTQAAVLRYGFETLLDYSFNRHWTAELKGEYLYARQKSGDKKGYTLPFSTPWSADMTVKYTCQWKGRCHIGLNAHVVGAQNEIVPPEKPTDGYWTLNVSASKNMSLRDKELTMTIRAENLLDRRYYNHTSYYRLIDVPEPGRNISVMMELEF